MSNPVYNIVQFILQKATELSITPEGIIVFTLILYGLSFFAMIMQDLIPGQIFIALIVIPGLFLFFSPISEWYTDYQYTYNPEPTDMDLSFAMLAIECTAPGVILSGILSGISIIIGEYLDWNDFKKKIKNHPEEWDVLIRRYQTSLYTSPDFITKRYLRYVKIIKKTTHTEEEMIPPLRL